MANTVCFNTNIVLILIIIFAGLLYYYQNHINNIKKNAMKKCKPCKPCKPCPTIIQTYHSQPAQIIQQEQPIHPVVSEDPVILKDKRDLHDPLRFPEERLDRHNLYLKDMAIRSGLAYTHTRGYPDTPKLRGYLYENTADGKDRKDGNGQRRILPLFGYETYPNSHRFKYYTLLNDQGLSNHLAPKIEIEYIIKNGRQQKINKQELYDDDIVQMNNLETSQFTVKLLERDEIRNYIQW